MSGLQYIGRVPDADYSVATKRYTTQRYDAVRVDADYINSQIALVASTLVNQTYVDAQDGLRATKAAVDSGDAGHILATQRGVVNGVAPVGSDGHIPSANLPSVQTERKPTFGVVQTTPLQGILKTVTAVNAKEYLAATMTIADPGYPYYPLVFALVRGGAISAPQDPSRSMGTPHFGQISILDSADVKYGWTLCSSRKVYDYHLCLPFADEAINPTTRPPVNGALTLNLYLGLWGGSTYTFDGTSPIVFTSINYPAV